MVSMNVFDATIADYLDKNPATLYEPRIEPSLSADPIITVKSQPLPDFGLNPTLNNLVVKLADYGEGKRPHGYFRVTQTDSTKPFQLRRPM
jgi:serine/threonine-protein kinase SRPK3